MKPILKPLTYVLAAVYFLVDAAFMTIAKPISDWVANHLVLRRLRAWIRSLRPYPSLALFSVPLIIWNRLNRWRPTWPQPARSRAALMTLIVGELLKLVLVERLFSLTRDKLMKIPAFALGATRFRRPRHGWKPPGLANHSLPEQCRPPIRGPDEKIRCAGVSATVEHDRF